MNSKYVKNISCDCIAYTPNSPNFKCKIESHQI